MARIFITGSSEGLGLMAAQLLAGEGHQVTLHAPNDARAVDVRRTRCRQPRRSSSVTCRASPRRGASPKASTRRASTTQ